MIPITEVILVGPITQLLPMNGLPLRGAISDELLPIINHSGIVVYQGKILEAGSYTVMESKYSGCRKVVFDHEVVVLPGFIDCHTHLCWNGSRPRDFAMRNAGFPYLDIAESGGGIWDTVNKTRIATDDELTTRIVERSKKATRWGVTTIEVKSGYGLSVEQEIRHLRNINKAGVLSDLDIIPTCLAAHTIPNEYYGNAIKYLDDIVNEIFPILRTEELTNRIDIYVERSAFDTQQAWDFLSKAKSLGFDILIHADQFTTGGSALGVKLGAVSVDHLEASTDYEILLVAKSDCVAVALPGASLGLGEPFTPARKILDAGGILAIASDWNPGSAPMGNLLIQASILATNQKLTTAEIFSALTFRAAKALKIRDRGSIKAGMIADFQCYETNDYREILYHQGLLIPSEVWKNGARIYEKPSS